MNIEQSASVQSDFQQQFKSAVACESVTRSEIRRIASLSSLVLVWSNMYIPYIP